MRERGYQGDLCTPELRGSHIEGVPQIQGKLGNYDKCIQLGTRGRLLYSTVDSYRLL